MVICGRKEQGLDDAVKSLGGGDKLVTVSAHIAKEGDVDRLFDQAMDRFGTIDALINNVGMNIVASAVDAEFSLWKKIIDSNLNGTFLVFTQGRTNHAREKNRKDCQHHLHRRHQGSPFYGDIRHCQGRNTDDDPGACPGTGPL